jgi:hypothetical protein
MLDFIATIVITAVMVVAINAVISSFEVSRTRRLAAALAVGFWIGLAAAAASSGLFTISRPFPYIAFFIVFPLLAVAALAAFSATWRTAFLRLPTPLLIGLNISRLFGAFFLLLAAAGRLSGPFPISAGWGDVITGMLAFPALWLASRPSNIARSFIAGWNIFGALDLLVALALGVASANNSPLQLIDAGAGSAAVQMLPWSFIPTVLVPFYLVVHGVIFAQLRRAAKPDSSESLAMNNV